MALPFWVKVLLGCVDPTNSNCFGMQQVFLKWNQHNTGLITNDVNIGILDSKAKMRSSIFLSSS